MQAKIVVLSFMVALGMSNVHVQELSWEDKETFGQGIEESVIDFLSYLPEIASKGHKFKIEQRIAMKYIENVLNLFIGSDNYGISED